MTNTKSLSPFDLKKPIRIRIANTATSARKFRDRGWCPVECCFGPESVVDDLNADHHGSLFNLEGVAIRGYRDHYGARKNDPRFVVTGVADEDACFFIASACGIIPHPSLADEYPHAPPGLRTIARMDMTHLATRINEVDLDPNKALALPDDFFGRMVLSWRLQGHPTSRDLLTWYGGVDRWRTLTTAQSDDFINASAPTQEQRFDEVMSARCEQISEDVIVVDLSAFGPNSAYYRRWLDKAPIIVAFIGGPEGWGTCSFVVRDLETSQRYFGKRGLLEIYPRLLPGGCGGREIIGGSNRTSWVRWSNAKEFGRQIDKLKR